MIEKLKQGCAYIFTIGVLIALFALPFPYGGLQRYGLYIAGFGFVLDYIVNKRWQGWRWQKEYWAFVAMMLFFLCIPVHQLFDPAHAWIYHSKLDTHFPFFLMGLMGIIGYNHKMRIVYAAPVMMLSCLLVEVLIITSLPDWAWNSFYAWRCAYRDYYHLRVNNHMMLNVYANVTLVYSAWIIVHSSWPKWAKWLVGALMPVIAACIFFTEGRTGQITFVVLIALFLVGWLYTTKRYKWIAFAGALVALLAFGVWQTNPRFHEYSAKNNARLYIWQQAISIIEEKPLLGWGVSGARQEFIERGKADPVFREHYLNEYENSSQKLYGSINYDIIHPHNVFLETLMEHGILGLIFLVLSIVLPVCLCPIGVNRWYLGACMLVFCIQACFECMGACLHPIWVPSLTLIWTYNADTWMPSGLSPAPSELA